MSIQFFKMNAESIGFLAILITLSEIILWCCGYQDYITGPISYIPIFVAIVSILLQLFFSTKDQSVDLFEIAIKYYSMILLTALMSIGVTYRLVINHELISFRPQLLSTFGFWMAILCCHYKNDGSWTFTLKTFYILNLFSFGALSVTIYGYYQGDKALLTHEIDFLCIPIGVYYYCSTNSHTIRLISILYFIIWTITGFHFTSFDNRHYASSPAPFCKAVFAATSSSKSTATLVY